METKGKHLLIDCRNVPKDICLDDGLMLKTLAEAAESAGATVLSQMRYKFGADSPPGYAVAVLLDESHCTAHSYAELGLIAMDIFTCGKTQPKDVLNYILGRLKLGDISVSSLTRF